MDPLPMLPASTVLMGPLFSNLIDNALKYSRKEVAPIIQIRSETNTEPLDDNKKEVTGRYCRIFIEDNGLGFEQKYAEQIFEMFRRLRSNADGTGIGLALCKEIVTNHHGEISATAKSGEGALFQIILPLTQQHPMI